MADKVVKRAPAVKVPHLVEWPGASMRANSLGDAFKIARVLLAAGDGVKVTLSQVK